MTSTTRPRSRIRGFLLAGGAIAALAAGAFVARPAPRPVAHHPEPRSGVADLGHTVMPASFFAAGSRQATVYAEAREIAETIDGIYCYCVCQETLGHRSLLQCFESMHGARCDICMREVEIAYEMKRNGRSLEDIRSAIDVSMHAS